MNVYKLEDYSRGWFIGNFDPAILKTCDFEIAVQHSLAGEIVTPHYQKTATEYSCIVTGNLLVEGKILGPGDIFVYFPMELCKVQFLTDATVVVVKTPSLGLDDKVVQ